VNNLRLASARPTTPEPQERPVVVINDRDLHELELELAKHIETRNARDHNPLVYIRSGRLVEVDLGRDGEAPALRDMTPSAFRSRVVAMVKTMRTDAKKGGALVATKPALDDLSGLYDRAHALGLPRLKQVTMCPTFDSRGGYHDQPGYIWESATYFAPESGVEVPHIPDKPTETDVQEALALLCEDLLGDFLLTNPAGDLAALLGLMLTPMVTELINGPRPLYVLDAPSAGSGKTKLTRMVTGHAVGDSTLPTAPTTSEEWGKALVSQARKGRAVMVFDNVNDTIDSGTFAAAVTAYPAWEARILGTSDNIELASPAAWVVTGNGMSMSAEMARRSMIVRIEPHPRDYTTWRHKDLDRWARVNRGRIQGALATLVQAWIAAGQPEGTAILPSFESWCRVIDGILRNAGIEGLMHGRIEQLDEVDEETQQWEQFALVYRLLEDIGKVKADGATAGEVLAALKSEHGSAAVPELPLGIDQFTSSKALGKKLSDKRGAVLGLDDQGRGLKLMRAKDRTKTWRYRVVVVE
jgi:hypothetical protein